MRGKGKRRVIVRRRGGEGETRVDGVSEGGGERGRRSLRERGGYRSLFNSGQIPTGYI